MSHENIYAIGAKEKKTQIHLKKPFLEKKIRLEKRHLVRAAIQKHNASGGLTLENRYQSHSNIIYTRLDKQLRLDSEALRKRHNPIGK